MLLYGLLSTEVWLFLYLLCSENPLVTFSFPYRNHACLVFLPWGFQSLIFFKRKLYVKDHILEVMD